MLQKMINKKNEKGFTLLELMVVIAIIGILGAIAIPSFAGYRRRAYSSKSNADIKNIYTSALAYFNDYPAASITAGTVDSSHPLYAYGFRPTSDVTTAVVANQQTQFTFQATAYHSAGDKTYTIFADGTISHT